MPEEALRLNGPALKIVQLCDGNRTVEEILNELGSVYTSVEPERMKQETLDLLERLNEKRAVDY